MKIAEFEKIVAEKSGLPTKDVKKVLAALASSVCEVVPTEGKLNLPGFGTFKLAERAARKGINPKTKEPLDIKASKAITFKLSKPRKEELN